MWPFRSPEQLDATVRRRWDGWSWKGVEVFSETAPRRTAAAACARALVAAAKRVDAPVLISMREPAAVQTDTRGRPVTWDCGIRAFWPDGSDGANIVELGLAPFLNDPQNLGPNARARELAPSSFDDGLALCRWNGAAARLWRLHFKRRPPRQ